MLDAGNLADNAFLFIGQGMVDQALALRPEERRPLFEEAAGVRRHERRRRQAEAELAEAESNLERLRDLLGELRPQAKRLSAQAEQLQARRTAGLELAEALLAVGAGALDSLGHNRARWKRRCSRTLTTRQMPRWPSFTPPRTRPPARPSRWPHTPSRSASRRETLEGHRARIVELRVTQARIGSELEALARESGRLSGEREVLDARLRESSLVTSTPAPQPDPALAAEIAGAERGLAEASGVLGADGDAAAAAALTRELDARRSRSAADRGTRRQMPDQRRRDRQPNRWPGSRSVSPRLRAERDGAVAELEATSAAESAAQTAHDSARESARLASATSMTLAEQLRQIETEAASAHAGLGALEAALESAVDDGLARAARARGGSLVAEGLEVEARFRQAVSAALGAAAIGLAVDDAAPLLSTKRQGTLVVRGGSGRRRGLSGGGQRPGCRGGTGERRRQPDRGDPARPAVGGDAPPGTSRVGARHGCRLAAGGVASARMAMRDPGRGRDLG